MGLPWVVLPFWAVPPISLPDAPAYRGPFNGASGGREGVLESISFAGPVGHALAMAVPRFLCPPASTQYEGLDLGRPFPPFPPSGGYTQGWFWSEERSKGGYKRARDETTHRST